MNIDFKAFRKANNLTQKELAEFLQCTQGFISQIEGGVSAAPQDLISKILARRDWDTSSLIDEDTTFKISDDMEIANLLSAIMQHGDEVRKQNEELRKQGDRLDRILDLVSRHGDGAVVSFSQTGARTSPPRNIDGRVKEL